jgi:hypothetical protein
VLFTGKDNGEVFCFECRESQEHAKRKRPPLVMHFSTQEIQKAVE